MLVRVLGNTQRALQDLFVASGVQVVSALAAQDQERLCGPRGRHDPQRQATRWGRKDLELILGGRKIVAGVGRVRSVGPDSRELSLPSLEGYRDEDPLSRRVLEQILCGVSTRRYARSLEELPEGVEERATSKSAVSRRFVALTAARVEAFLSRPLRDQELLVLMLDGVQVRGTAFLVALGIDGQGHKRILGLRQGATENARVCTDLLADLVERGLNTKKPLLVVLDGSKALRKAVVDVLGPLAVVQRCQLHKRRNLSEYLPPLRHAQVEQQMVAAYQGGDAERAQAQLERLARSLERGHPDAATSLREGLEETLAVLRLNLPPLLRRVLSSTNAIESVFAHYAHLIRNVKRWRDGQMVRRWTATMLVEAECRFHRLKGYQQLPKLAAALHSFLSLDDAAHAA